MGKRRRQVASHHGHGLVRFPRGRVEGDGGGGASTWCRPRTKRETGGPDCQRGHPPVALRAHAGSERSRRRSSDGRRQELGEVAAECRSLPSFELPSMWRGVAPAGGSDGALGARASRSPDARAGGGRHGAGDSGRASTAVSVSPLQGDVDGSATRLLGTPALQRGRNRLGLRTLRNARRDARLHPGPY